MSKEKPFAELVAIVRAGGGLDFSAEKYSIQELAQLARAANVGACRVTMRGMAARSQNDLVLIGRAGGGTVNFVL